MELSRILGALVLVWPELNEQTKFDLATRFAIQVNSKVDDKISTLEKQKIDAEKIIRKVSGIVKIEMAKTEISRIDITKIVR